MTRNLSRRTFLARTLATSVGVPLLGACGLVPPASSGSSGGPQVSGAQGAAKSLLPTYLPVQSGPKPDYHDDNPLFSDGYDNYPQNPRRANAAAPGAGSTFNVLTRAYSPMPTLRDQNPTWQAVDKQLNATMNLNVIPGADYQVKFATVLSSDDLPDLMHIYFGYTLAPNLPDFFKAKCADLSPYLSGDAARDYPYLAAIPTLAWRNSISAISGGLYLIPIHRPMFSIGPGGGNFFRNIDQWDTELGQNFVPRNADDFKRALQQVTKPQQNQWGIGNFGTTSQLFGLGVFAQMFGAPNGWSLDASGKLLRDRETEPYKAAIAYIRDLFAAGVYWPDSVTATNTNSRAAFVAKKFAISPEGQGNSWIDFWERGLQQTPPTRFGMMNPFAAQEGRKPITFLGTGFVSMNALRKNTPDKIKELLRIMNWLASPFGSQEDLLLSYGLEGQDYTKDEKGNPVPTTDGLARSSYVPWRYIAQHPWVYYQADLPAFARASYDAEQATLPLGIDDPTSGYYSPTQYGKGNQADLAWQDGVREIIAGHAPMSSYDGLVATWRSAVGDQIRKEYLGAFAAKA